MRNGGWIVSGDRIIFKGNTDITRFGFSACENLLYFYIPYLPYIFGRIKIIIFFTVRTFNLEKNYNFFSV